ncbi:type IV pilin protein [uncultured Paraglaciecola sp.]|uniref:type IV pilin protein n=1 Tax=uncultured Paraglaciecola sp. TaxID=1765024 RepID=UPI00261A08E0|nr:type IV pilin protein [uncultured Paraglaciecola sp.]
MPIHFKDRNPQRCSTIGTEDGVTLIELMVVVIIIGVLASVIFPTFKQQILASRRGDGITQLLRLKIQQEAFRLENDSFATTAQLGLPTSEYYTFSVSNVSATTYTIHAQAIASQTSDIGCVHLQIDQSLNKTPSTCFL